MPSMLATNDSSQIAGVADEETNMFGKSVAEIARDTPKYAFTEFITLKFKSDAWLEDDATLEGRIWAETIRTYVEHDSTGPVWWGRTVEERGTVKLLIEWHTISAHQDFLGSPVYRELALQLGSILSDPADSKLFVLPRYSGTRENTLSSRFLADSYTALYTWTFRPPLETSFSVSVLGRTYTGQSAWEHYWQAWVLTAMQSHSVVSNTAAHAWSLKQDEQGEEQVAYQEFCGLMRWKGADGHKAYIDVIKDQGWQGGVLHNLGDMMALGMELCHVQFICLNNGWLGSVTKELPDVKQPNGLFK